MQPLEETLRAVVLGSPEVVAVMGDRWYPGGVFPQGVVYPAAALTVVSRPGQHTYGGVEGFTRNRVQVDCLAETADEARKLANAIRLRLDGFRGMVNVPDVGLVEVQGVFMITDGDVGESSLDTSGPAIRRRKVEFFVAL